MEVTFDVLTADVFGRSAPGVIPAANTRKEIRAAMDENETLSPDLSMLRCYQMREWRTRTKLCGRLTKVTAVLFA